MKKISLVLCFALMLVLLFAFNAFAATQSNIAKDARLENDGSTSNVIDQSLVVDGKYDTASSCGNSGENWVNYRFFYDEGVTVSKVRVILNGTGTLSNGKVYDSVSQNNYTFYIRLYAEDNKTIYYAKEFKNCKDLQTSATDAEGNVYTYYELVFETPYSNIYQVEVPVVNNKNADIGLWEVEIFDYTCVDSNDHIPVKDDANCTTASMCSVCGAEIVPAMLHDFDDETNLCKNEGCGVYFVPGCFEDYQIGSTTMMEKYYGDTVVYDDDGNYLGGYGGGGNNSFGGIFDNKTDSASQWGDGAAPHDSRQASGVNPNMTLFFKKTHLVRSTTVYYVERTVGAGFTIEISSDGGKTWTEIGSYAAENNYGTIVPVTFYLNNGLGIEINAMRFIFSKNPNGWVNCQVAVTEWDITASTPLECTWNDGIVTTEPTCGAKGVKTITCINCGDKYTEEIEATGLHAWGEGVETKPATETEDGIMTYTCTVCSATYEETISAIKHNYVATVTPPTCTAKGYTTYTCDGTCGVEGCTNSYVDKDSYVTEIPHAYDEKVTIKATALNQGLLTYTCSACGDSYTKTTPKLDWGDDTSVIGSNNIVDYDEYFPTEPYGDPEPSDLFDGIINTSASDSKPDGWYGPTNSTLLITLDKEYYVINFKFSIWANWQHPTIQLLDKDKNLIAEQGYWGLNHTDTSKYLEAENLANKVGVKYVKIICNMKAGHTGGNTCAFQEFQITVHNHNRDGEIENYVEPTCTTKGSYDESCSVCGLTYHVEVPALGHTWTETDRVEPTCTADGSVDYVCYVCDLGAKKTDKIDALGHLKDETVEGVVTVPTCTSAGYTTYVCATCGENYNADEIAALGHAWDNENDTECNNNCGYVRGIARIGEQYFATLEEAIAAGDEIVVIGKVTVEGDATWNFAGKTITLAYADENNYAVVVKGNLTIVDGTFNVQALFGFGVTGTLTVNGGTFNADATYVDYMIGSWGTTVINNGTFNGKYCNVNAFAGTATINGGSFVVAGDDSGYDPIDVEGYTTINAGTFSTDVSAFVAEGKCQYANGAIAADISDTYYAVDGMEIKIENGIAYVMGGEYALSYDAVNNSYTSNSPRVSFGFDRGGNLVFGMGGQLHKHTADMYIATVTAPTCTKDGYTTYECMGCGHTYTDNVVPATGHGKAVIKEEIAPTCTADGSITKVCADCGEVVSTETIPAAHTWDEGTTQLWPNCTNTGIERYTCTVCGEIHTEELPIDPENHNYWPDWETRVPATCIKGGYEKEVCQNCGDVQENITEPDTEYGHEWVINKETFVQATCIADGYRERKCSLCNAEEAGALDKEIFGDHDYVIDEKPATCKEDGYTKKTCKLCDYLDVEPIPANDWSHDYKYSANGIFKECAICGDWGMRDTINGGNEEAVADYSIYFMSSDVINIYHTEDYSVLDECYKYTIAKNEDGTYTITIGECYNGNDTFKLANTTAKFEIKEDGGVVTFTNADGVVYTFDNIPEEEPDQPEVDNNSIINGIYETADCSVKVQFKDGVATVLVNEAGAPLPETFEYDYNSMTGMIDCDGVQMIVSYSINDKAIYFGMMPLYKVGESGDDEPDEPEINYGSQIDSIEVIVTNDHTYGFNILKSYTASKAGQYSFYIPATLGFAYKDELESFGSAEIDHNDNKAGYYVVINLGAGDTVEFYVGALVEGDFAIDVYYYTDAPAHVHTEVAIDAILPTPSTIGYTAGIECSVCGAIIKAPVEIKVTQTDIVDQFRIDAISLEAKENIAVNYKTYAKAGYNNPYIVFVFNGNEYMMLEPTKIDGDGRLVFKFDQTFPQLMQDNIEAYFYAETAVGEYAMDSVQEYSVLTYILKQLKKNDAALTTVMSDILYMGAKTQIFMNYKTDALVTDLAAAQGYTLTPTAFTEIPSSANITKVTGDRTTGTDWYSTSLAMGASTEAILKFQTDDASNLKIKIAFEGKIYTYNASELKTEVTEDGLVYLIYFDQVKSFEYDKVITATFERDGEQVGSTITYSINSFLARNYNKSSQPANAKELMKALYTYGVSSAAYFG